MTISLRDLSFDQALPSYSIDLSYSADNIQEKIAEAASFASRIYAEFPQMAESKRVDLRTKGLWLGRLNDLAPALECKQFETALKDRIIAVLNQKQINECYINLSTDYHPEGELRRIAESVFKNQKTLSFLFPYKTNTSIYLNDRAIHISMNLKGPLF